MTFTLAYYLPPPRAHQVQEGNVGFLQGKVCLKPTNKTASGVPMDPPEHQLGH